MKVTNNLPVAVLLLAPALAMTPAPGQAGEEVDLRKSVPGDGVVRIENVRGEIVISGWDEDQVSVEGELDDMAEGLKFEVDGQQTLIRVEMPGRNVNRGDGSDLRIRVPANSDLKVETVSADVMFNDVHGTISVRTVSGDVHGEQVAKDTRVNTVSGDVLLIDGEGRVSIVTVSGDAKVELQASDVAIDTMSGEIELDLGDFDSLDARSVNGEFEIAGRLNKAGRIDGSTVNGDIELRLLEPVNAQLDIRTGPGGEIENELTSEAPTELFPNAMELKTAVGDGSGGIRLVTVNGDIRLESG